MRKGTRRSGLFREWFKNCRTALAAGCLLAVLPLTAAHADGAPAAAVPTDQGILHGTSTRCATDESAPDGVGDPQPLLTARVHGEAGASQSADLRAHFTVDSRTTDGSWTTVDDQLMPSTGFTPDDSIVRTTVSTPLAANTLYRMSVASWDYADDHTQYTVSDPTAFCYFTVDPTAPLAPKITYGGPYTECTANDCVGHGGAGIPGTFTFAPADGEDSPVVGYRYRFTSGGTYTTASGPTVTITFTPPYRTLETLYVAARDALGRYGPETNTSFKVG